MQAISQIPRICQDAAQARRMCQLPYHSQWRSTGNTSAFALKCLCITIATTQFILGEWYNLQTRCICIQYSDWMHYSARRICRAVFICPCKPNCICIYIVCCHLNYDPPALKFVRANSPKYFLAASSYAIAASSSQKKHPR